MSESSPVAVQAFRELKAANRALLSAMAREKRTRAAFHAAVAKLAEAKREVKRLIDVVQPELSLAGVLDQDSAMTLGETVGLIGALPDGKP